ncbi:hypothetical protein RAS12_00550 [Achromobacter seleniivolatilans]|uniref:Uncharacterized protein n=1 Tax=Achromobacter seleniivolatilans TaxID=3047478 RepID=A0ABY9M3Z3_9BURK|nr:hypothetical protein [Achromobacter sp. R39]WMD20893.1 hypothetical protein RAS12_00550 [Achromobacter sp. R39]
MDTLRHFSAFPSSAFLLFVLCISGGAVVLIAIFRGHGWLATVLFAAIIGTLALLMMPSAAHGYERTGQMAWLCVPGIIGCREPDWLG